MAPESEPNTDGAGATGESGTVDSSIAGGFQALKDAISRPKDGGVVPGQDQYGVSTRE